MSVKDFALRYRPEAVQRILELTRGHPFQLHFPTFYKTKDTKWDEGNCSITRNSTDANDELFTAVLFCSQKVITAVSSPRAPRATNSHSARNGELSSSV